MMGALIAVVLSTTLEAAPPPAGSPKKAEQRVLLHTIAGDLVLALYPEIAPRHVAQISRLVALGAYDSTHFCRLEPNFVAQVSVAEDRKTPLTPEQQAAIHPIKAEFSALPHRRGSLSMARDDGALDSASTSFSVLLAPAPHLDGKYTVFGEVESGMEAIEEMFKVPRKGSVPLVRLEIMRAELVSTATLASMRLAQAQPVSLPPGTAAGAAAPALQAETASGLLLMVLLAVAGFFASGRIPERWVRSLGLLQVLLGVFLLWVVLTPLARDHAFIGVALFAGTIGVLKLMGRFESPPSSG